MLKGEKSAITSTAQSALVLVLTFVEQYKDSCPCRQENTKMRVSRNPRRTQCSRDVSRRQDLTKRQPATNHPAAQREYKAGSVEFTPTLDLYHFRP
jgi:hypothetical protein